MASITASLDQDRSSLRRDLTFRERVDPARRITQTAAVLVILLVLLLLLFIAINGIQIFTDSGVSIGKVLNPTWNPPIDIATQNDPKISFGIIPFIAGTIAVTLLAVAIATPLSVGLSVYMAEVAPRWARSIAQPAMEVFVGIPSVVWGWLGITILVPFLRQNFHNFGFTTGFSWLAGSVVLALMILPTVSSISYDVFLSVPSELRSGSIALGTTRWQTIRHVVLPAAVTGVATAIVLGMARAAGEALAVQMVIGNTPVFPSSIAKPLTTLTSQITLDMGNTVQGTAWNQALWTMGLVLLMMSFASVLFVRWLARKRNIA